MHANNEVGTIQDLAEISRLAHEQGVLVHTDAAQSIGKVPVDVGALGVDFLTLAGHKLYAPKGVGALFIRSGVELPRLLHGASHEAGPARRDGERPRDRRPREGVRGRRAEAPARRPPVRGAPRAALRGALPGGPRPPPEQPVGALPPEHAQRRLPGRRRGRAPGGDRRRRSPPPRARRATPPASRSRRSCRRWASRVEYAMGTVRFSVGRGTTPAMVDEAARVVAEAVHRMRPGPPGRSRNARGRRPGEADPLHPRDGLRVQAAAAGPRGGAEVAPEGDRPRRPRRPRALRRRGRLPADRRPRDRLDRRLLHADRRRPVRLRRHQRRELAQRHLRDGGEAALRPQRRRLPLAPAPPLRPRADPRGGGRGRARGGDLRSSAGTRWTTPSRSSASRSRASSTPTAS